MASCNTNGDKGDGCSGGWRDRKKGGNGEDRDRDSGHGQRGYRKGNGGGDYGKDGAFKGYRRGGGERGRFNNGRGFSGGHKRPNGFTPRASRFDDDLKPPPPKLDMTPVGNVGTNNVYWETCEKERAAAAVKKVPFVFEPPETDFHLEAAGLLRELREERDKWAVKDLRGNLIGDCLGAHSYGDLCQFCDGRRGSWAKSSNAKADPAFKRYQDSIIASMPSASESSIGLPRKSKLNTLQLVPFEDPEVVAADFEEMTLGIVADEKITDIV